MKSITIIIFSVLALITNSCSYKNMEKNNQMNNVNNKINKSNNNKIIGRKYESNFVIGKSAHGYSLMNIDDDYSDVSFEFKNREVYNNFFNKIENSRDKYRVICMCRLTYAGNEHYILNGIENCYLESRDKSEKIPF